MCQHGTRAIARDNLLQAPLAYMCGSNLRVYIPLALLRRAHVAIEEAQNILIELAAAHELHRRNNHALLIQLTRHRHRARRHPADIGMMRAAGDESEQLSTMPIGIIANED